VFLTAVPEARNRLFQPVPVPIVIRSNNSLTSAPRWPHTWQVNFGSRSASRTWSVQRLELTTTDCAHCNRRNRRYAGRPLPDLSSPNVIFCCRGMAPGPSRVGREKIPQGKPYRDVKADKDCKTDNQDNHSATVAGPSGRFNYAS
jgi:hypothetical protein